MNITTTKFRWFLVTSSFFEHSKRLLINKRCDIKDKLTTINKDGKVHYYIAYNIKMVGSIIRFSLT